MIAWIESFVLNYWTAFGLICVLLYFYIQNSLKYWQKRGVPLIESQSPLEIIFNIISGKKSLSEVYEDVYNRLEGHRFGGVYLMLTPILVLRDPEIIKCIMSKDFESFHERGMYVDEKKDPLAANVFTAGGTRWKKFRAKLSPGFTPKNMRLMFKIMLETTEDLVSHFDTQGHLADVKEIFARFSMDVIASVAFGIKINCLNEPENEFREWGKKVFAPTLLSGVRNLINCVAPKLASIIYIRFFTKEITEHFCNMVRETIDHRKKYNIKRNDFMQMLLQLKEKGYIEDPTSPEENAELLEEKISYNEIAAQAVIFFTAGFETSGSSLAFCIHEIAMNPDIQSRLHEEICTVLKRYNGEITYDALQELEYMDMVISESLRKYPPATNITRMCTEDYILPGTNSALEKGTSVIIPILGLHRDPQYFPEPEKFNPERFSQEAKKRIPSFVYMPFGEGPRSCIATRFAIMEMKLAVCVLLKNYEFQACSQTIHPLVFDPRAFALRSANDMWVRVIKRSGK
ncbi:probable cytochrome P450 6a13 isoform X1 [Periplaneta americana]|uniref:probable cytochrome P450 6a13 isoform X1 n=1 Tax=Periplaneta americana TaxID=6978 RepID=UPI0037E96CD1